MEIEIKNNVPKPEVVKKDKYSLEKIPEGGAAFVRPTGKETLKSVAASVKAAVSKFKKNETKLNLSVHVRKDFDQEGDCVIIYHNKKEGD